MIRNSALCLTAIGLITASAIAGPPIERLAPRNTVIVAGVKNVQESRRNLESTALWSLFTSDSFSEAWASVMTKVEPAIQDACDELGLARDSLTWPEGGLGAAIFWVRDEEIGMPYPGLMVYADWGKGADGVATLIDKSVAKATEQGMAPKKIEVVGREAYRFEIPKDLGQEEEDEFDDIDMGGPGMGMGGIFGDPASALENIDSIYLVRSDTSFLLSTELSVMSDALEVIDGKALPCLADRDDFKGIMNQLGQSETYEMFLTRDATQLLGGPQGLGMAGMFLPMIKQFIGDIQGIGANMNMAAGKAMIEQTTAIYMPNGKSGLTALLDTQTAPAGLPAFAGKDIVSYSTVNFEFKGLPVMIQTISQMFPMPGMAGSDGPSPADMAKMICDPLGPQIHIIQYAHDEPTLSDSQPLYAIQSKGRESLEGFLTQSGMFPMDEGKDLGDGRVYKLALDQMGAMGGMPMDAGAGPMMPEMSLGLTDNYLFVGPTGAVENAMEGSGAKPAATKMAGWAQAMKLVGNEPVMMWGYSDLPTMIGNQVQMQMAMMDEMMEQYGMGEDPDQAGEMMEGQEFLNMLKDFDWSSLHEYMGPNVVTGHATDDGFLFKSYLLPPAGGK